MHDIPSPACLNYLEFLCCGGMFKKAYAEILMKVRRGAPGGRCGKMNQKFDENPRHLFTQTPPPSPPRLHLVRRVASPPSAHPQLWRNETFLIVALMQPSLVPLLLRRAFPPLSSLMQLLAVCWNSLFAPVLLFDLITQTGNHLFAKTASF